MSSEISDIKAREILDSRGYPTIQVEVALQDGSVGVFSVPSGASTGEHEALELRDQDPKRYQGRGILKALSNIREIIKPALLSKRANQQSNIDALLIELDGTQNKSRLGANAILGVSMAVARAAAVREKVPFYVYLGESSGFSMPMPLMNILNGGVHADSGLSIQEFMIVPHGFSNFRESLRAGSEIFHTLKKILKAQEFSVAVGDEGGFAPRISKTTQALDLILEAIEAAGFKPDSEVSLALDVASSEFYDASKQGYFLHDKGFLDSTGMIQFLETLCSQYPIISIEDALDQNDWAGWKKLTDHLGSRVQLVGDDLFVTQAHFICRGIDEKVANAVLIKLNQVGTLTETKQSIYLCRQAGYKHVVSHRSGETEDSSIADLAVATQAAYIKTGSLCRSERTAKYNRLLVIEEELGL